MVVMQDYAVDFAFAAIDNSFGRDNPLGNVADRLIKQGKQVFS
jgi:hypothetical protein